jgi:hypothetical protein
LWCNRSYEIVRGADTIAHYDGTPTTHGLVNHHGERLVLRGQDHGISRGVDSWELGLVNEAKKVDPRGNAKSYCFGFELRAERTFASEN